MREREPAISREGAPIDVDSGWMQFLTVRLRQARTAGVPQPRHARPANQRSHSVLNGFQACGVCKK